jgi:hypothetical protein
VRPENIALSLTEPDRAENKLPARIATAVMLGDTIEFVLHTDEGRDFISRMPRRSVEALAAGTAVWAHWDAQFLCLFPHEELSRRAQAAEAG